MDAIVRHPEFSENLHGILARFRGEPNRSRRFTARELDERSDAMHDFAYRSSLIVCTMASPNPFSQASGTQASAQMPVAFNSPSSACVVREATRPAICARSAAPQAARSEGNATSSNLASAEAMDADRAAIAIQPSEV